MSKDNGGLLPGTLGEQYPYTFSNKAAQGIELDTRSPRDNRVAPSSARIRQIVDIEEMDKEEANLMKILFDFGDYVSAAGLPRVFTEKSSKWSRILYAVVFLVSFGASIYFSSEIIAEYRRYPVNVNVKLLNDAKLDFPSVTVCNTNRVRQSAILQSKYSDLEYLLSDRSLGGLYYPPCLSNDFLCTSSNECLRSFRVCDGIRHCDGYEDEDSCEYGACGYRQHKCETGGTEGYCISDEYVCDGTEQCYDSSDEADCADNCKGFECDDQSDCVATSQVCDGTSDCLDGSDESNCTSSFTCPGGYWKCATTDDCIYSDWVCDDYADCDDRSDEPPQATCPTGSTNRRRRRGVSSPTSSGCLSCVGRYSLDNTTLECFPTYYECDGYVDCLGGTDEASCGTINYNCPSNNIACDDGSCIHQIFVCDGWDDCPSGSDEDNCEEASDDNSTVAISDLFGSGWTAPYEHIVSNNDDFYADFENYYVEEKYNQGFERVDSEDPPDWHGFATFSATGDFSDLEDVVKLSKSDLRNLGHQAEDLILQCTFDQRYCDSGDFTVIQDDKYGNCFTFNHYSNNNSYSTSGAGPIHGLKLTLFTEQSEYISIYGQESGVRVSVHQRGKTPFPEDDGFTATPGKGTGVGIKQTVVNRQDPPHGNCSVPQSFESIYGDDYSMSACQKQCLQDYLEKECGCVDTIMVETVPRCQILNRTQEMCRQLMYYMQRENKLDCVCKQPCNEVLYSKTLSQSMWPSNVYLYHLLKSIHSINEGTKDINDFEQAQLNLARLEVYFEDMTYTEITEVPKYEGVYNLLSEIGGVIGLYVGLSFITVVEFMEFLFDLIKIGCLKIGSAGKR